ncbi:MAG: RES domain-containing protein [Lysobacteraceae bacterium]|nr:MAG: RES domain-containing protein [Xanthomonadaceae bacterium]
MMLWRIASTGRGYLPDDLSGTGASIDPGRWNDNGQFVVYASPSLALAVLETAAHIDDRGLPLNRYVIRIEVPAAIWKKRRQRTPKDLAGGWDAVPHGLASIREGADWYSAGREALLEIPSAIVPEERNILINARHPDAVSIKATTLRRFDYNILFRR